MAPVLELLPGGFAGARGLPGMTARAGGDRGFLVDGEDHRPLGRVEAEGAHFAVRFQEPGVSRRVSRPRTRERWPQADAITVRWH